MTNAFASRPFDDLDDEFDADLDFMPAAAPSRGRRHRPARAAAVHGAAGAARPPVPAARRGRPIRRGLPVASAAGAPAGYQSRRRPGGRRRRRPLAPSAAAGRGHGAAHRHPRLRRAPGHPGRRRARGPGPAHVARHDPDPRRRPRRAPSSLSARADPAADHRRMPRAIRRPCCAQLDRLAEVCDAGTKVVVIGADQRHRPVPRADAARRQRISGRRRCSRCS